MPRDQAYHLAEKKIEEAQRAIASASHHTDRRIPLNETLSSLEPIPFSKVPLGDDMRRTLSYTKGGHHGT